MPEQLYTRCPACHTVFRVTPAQLALRAGQVRCGHCQTVFDGKAALIAPARAGTTDEPSVIETTPESPDAALGATNVAFRTEPTPSPAADAAVAPPVEYEQRFSWDRTQRRQRGLNVLFAVGVPLLIALLVVQTLFHFRDFIAARWPATHGVLAQMCAVAGCSVEAPRDIEVLAIEGSDLQADPAHRGLLILTATVRNRSGLPVSYPHLELSLTDSRDQTVASRALAPADYAGGADVRSGIAANAEIAIKLFVDASATDQAGYRLYMFYP